jgi:hypothetical protein
VLTLGIATGALCATFFVFLILGEAKGALLLCLVTLVIGPITIIYLHVGYLPDTVGISPAIPSFSTYSVVLFSLALYFTIRGKANRFSGLIVPLLCFLPIGFAFAWPDIPQVWSGLLHMAAIASAWVVGLAIGRAIMDDNVGRRFLVALLFGLAVVLAGSVLWQLLVSGLSGSEYGNRATGIFGHPATMGKLSIALLALVLPLTRSVDLLCRRLSLAAFVLLLIATAPTLSRANILGFGIVVVVWLVLLRGERTLAIRLGLPVFLFVALLPFLGLLLSRFERDAEGGDRPALLAAGLRVIQVHLWGGVGPNGFVPEAEKSELIVAATGFPVHNTFLLAVAELGLTGAGLLFLPLVFSLGVAIRHLRALDQVGDVSRAVVAVLAGVIFVGLTGWGYLQGPVVQLTFFVVAVNLAAMQPAARASGEAQGDGLTAEPEPRTGGSAPVRSWQ